MARGILLDSSVVIPHLRGRHNLETKAPPGEPMFLPLTVVGELYKGVFKSKQVEQNRLSLEAFCEQSPFYIPTSLRQFSMPESQLIWSSLELRFLKTTSGSQPWPSNAPCH